MEYTTRIMITVGPHNADIIGTDHLAIQSAVDYVARFGGGTVQLLPAVYDMRNSLFMRPQVRLAGSGEDSVLRKCASGFSALTEDTDWYSRQVHVADPGLFKVGGGILLRGTCPHYGKPLFVKRTVSAVDAKIITLDSPARENFWLEKEPTAATLFPVITAEHVDDVIVENLTIDGNKGQNENLDGNRGGCIFIQDCNRWTIRQVTARDYNGDGISWQVCDDIIIDECRMIGNTDLGLHPGSGSQRPVITRNFISGSSQGLFFCWGVRHGIAEGNSIEDCSRYGISIGHRDTDNMVRENTIRRSGEFGVLFREHPAPRRDPHRNTFMNNTIEDSGTTGECIAVQMLGTAQGVVLEGNRICDTRPSSSARNRIGIAVGSKITDLSMRGNTFENMEINIRDEREG